MTPPHSAHQPLSADATVRVAQTVAGELQAGLFPGAVILGGTAEQILYHEAFGLAQVVPAPVPMRRDAIFDVASITKAVNTTTSRISRRRFG